MEKPSTVRLIQYMTLIIWSMEEETRSMKLARELIKEGKDDELYTLCQQRQITIERTARLLREQFPEFQPPQPQRFMVPLTSNN